MSTIEEIEAAIERLPRVNFSSFLPGSEAGLGLNGIER